MSKDLSNKIMFLDRNERSRLAGLLSGMEPVAGIKLGRWWQLVGFWTDYISIKEIESLHDVTFPPGYALDIIRGNRNVICKKVKDSSGRWYACIAEKQRGNLDLSGYEPRRTFEVKIKPKLKQRKDKPGNLDLIGYEPRRTLEVKIKPKLKQRKDKPENWISGRLKT